MGNASQSRRSCNPVRKNWLAGTAEGLPDAVGWEWFVPAPQINFQPLEFLRFLRFFEAENLPMFGNLKPLIARMGRQECLPHGSNGWKKLGGVEPC
jgi:hypothetical protein